MVKSRVALRGVLGVSLLALATTSALAQEAPGPVNEADDDIIVTANKRETTLQETPIAITAVTADAVELRGISETKDLAAIAPNVTVTGGTTNATAAVVSIRGIPTAADETLGFDSPIGLYLDGVYLARSAVSSFEIADIERIEVLRGPQGTLWGRNTTGGAINYITKRPDSDAGAKVKFGYGNYDQKTARIILNSGDMGPIRMSLGYLYKSRDGVVDNLLRPSDEDPGAYETHGARWAFEVDLAPNLLLTNIFDWSETDAAPPASQLSGIGDGTFRPNVTIGGNVFPQVQPANVRGYLANATVLEPECGSDPLAYVSEERLDEICLNGAGLSTDEVYGNMTRLELDTDWVTIRSTTAFRWWRNEIRGSDLDGLGTLQGPVVPDANTLFFGFPAPILEFIVDPATAAFLSNLPPATTTQALFQARNDREQDQFSQEIELIGGSGTAFEWVLGGFYFEESGSEVNPQTFAFILDTNLAVYGNPAFGGLIPLLQASNPAQYRAFPIASTLGYEIDAKSYALYGQGTFRPGGAGGPLGITLGLRYTWDEREITRFQNGFAPIATAEELALNDQKAKFSEPTGHITVDYQPNNALNLYAKVARGYRSGGFNARQSTQVDNPATPDVDESVALIPFGAEKITSWEAGAKTRFGPLRLNAAAFYNQYKDLQVAVPIPIEGGGSFGTQVVNSGKTDYTGAEIEAVFEVTEALTIDGAVGYLDVNVKEFPSADVNGDLGNIADVISPGYAPEWTAAAAITYSDYLGNSDTRLTARLGWTYTAEQTSFSNPLTAPFTVETDLESRSLFNAQLRLDGVSLGGGPEFSVLAWGKNIFDKEYRSRGIDFGALGFGEALYGDPATYGVEIEFSF